MKSIDVVCGVIYNSKNQILITERGDKKFYGKWEFPGGKVESNETFTEALSREIKEELNITISLQNKIAEEKFKDERIDIVLHYFLCTQQSGIIELNEHEDLAWVEKKDFDKYNFVEGDGNILSLL